MSSPSSPSPWFFSVKKCRMFSRAASLGNLPLVESLSVDPEVNLNWRDEVKRTPFYYACHHGHVEVVRYLLNFHDNHKQRKPINLKLADDHGNSPFSASCVYRHEEIVEMLADDERIDVNRADIGSRTPLWYAAFWGHAGVAKRILASKREILLTKKDREPCRMTAGKVALREGKRALHNEIETAEEFEQKKKRFFDMAAWIEAYEVDPGGVRKRLRKELEWDERLAGELFALVVYLSDGYLSLCPENNTPKEQKFFSIATRLPIELQMVLCNHVFAVSCSIVKRAHSEKGFKKFAKGI